MRRAVTSKHAKLEWSSAVAGERMHPPMRPHMQVLGAVLRPLGEACHSIQLTSPRPASHPKTMILRLIGDAHDAKCSNLSHQHADSCSFKRGGGLLLRLTATALPPLKTTPLTLSHHWQASTLTVCSNSHPLSSSALCSSSVLADHTSIGPRPMSSPNVSPPGSASNFLSSMRSHVAFNPLEPRRTSTVPDMEAADREREAGIPGNPWMKSTCGGGRRMLRRGNRTRGWV